MSVTKTSEQIVKFGKSIFDRGLTAGTSGNISVRLRDGWLMTPTNSSLGDLDPAKMSRLEPGDLKLADAVRALAGKHHAVLLANHGPVVAGTSLEAAVAAVEELEETAKLFLLLQGHRVRYLTSEQLEELGIQRLR